MNPIDQAFQARVLFLLLYRLEGKDFRVSVVPEQGSTLNRTRPYSFIQLHDGSTLTLPPGSIIALQPHPLVYTAADLFFRTSGRVMDTIAERMAAQQLELPPPKEGIPLLLKLVQLWLCHTVLAIRDRFEPELAELVTEFLISASGDSMFRTSLYQSLTPYDENGRKVIADFRAEHAGIMVAAERELANVAEPDERLHVLLQYFVREQLVPVSERLAAVPEELLLEEITAGAHGLDIANFLNDLAVAMPLTSAQSTGLRKTMMELADPAKLKQELGVPPPGMN